MKENILLGLFLGIAATAAAGPDNKFANPSFEGGRESWISLAAPDKEYWHDFSIAPDPKDPAHKCARLDLTSAEARAKTEVCGVIQEVKESGQIPHYLHGRYFVADWKRGTPKQYIQAVVNVWATGNNFGKRGEHSTQPIPVQIAFVLGGISEPPFKIVNRKFVFSGPLDPKVGEWIEFEFDLRAALEKEWGFLPKEFRGFRVLFEARFDERAETEKDARATVYFDDLYLGDESRTPPAAPVVALPAARR